MLIEQLPPSAPPTDQVYPAGRLSESVTPVGSARAGVVTTIVNVAFWPAWTVPLSGVFATETSGQLTTTEADA